MRCVLQVFLCSCNAALDSKSLLNACLADLRLQRMALLFAELRDAPLNHASGEKDVASSEYSGFGSRVK